MTDARPNHIVVFCEALGDLNVAQGFGERVLLEHIEWLRDGVEARPTWGGLREKPFERWANIKTSYADDPSLPSVRSKEMDGRPPEPDAISALKALRMAEKVQPLAVVLLRDVDAEPGRKQGLAQGRKEYQTQTPTSVKAVIGLADRYQEAWLLTAFTPRNDRETATLEGICAEVPGVHPTKQAHLLRGGEGDARHAKSIWARLSDRDAIRTQSCWEETALETLQLYGEGCGLKAYLEEVEKILVPLLHPVPFKPDTI